MILSPGRTEMISSSESEDEQQSFRGLAFKIHKKKMEEESKKAKTKENAEKAKKQKKEEGTREFKYNARNREK